MRVSIFLVLLLVAMPVLGQTIDESILTELESILTELETGYQELQTGLTLLNGGLLTLRQELTISQSALTDLETSFKDYEKTVETQIGRLERTSLFLKIGIVTVSVGAVVYIAIDLLR